ncbi:MAG TPA: hypothetical protein VGZ24_11580 [Chthoniobacterales bacterium]|nr:hypothetical protein [Chthoniobacterales bacterium]
MSPSQQFIIYGADGALRGAVSELAERTKANFLALLRRLDRWKTPVIINLQLSQADVPKIQPAALRFSQTGFGLKLQLDLTITQDVDGSLVERALLRAILLEIIYRNQPDIAPGTPYVQPPDWLLDGALALTPGRDRGPLVEALLLSEKIMPLEELLRPRSISDLDSPARLLYRAYSFALVQFAGRCNGRACAAGRLHRQSIASLHRSARRFEGPVSGVRRRRARNLALKRGSAGRHSELSIARLCRNRATPR